MQHYLAMWTNFFNFSGRTSRKGYWMAVLFNFIVSFAVGFVGGLIGIEWLGTVYGYAVAIPAISMAVRRLRDAGKHWAWWFINFVPAVGQIIFIIMLCQPSVAPAQPAYDSGYQTYDY